MGKVRAVEVMCPRNNAFSPLVRRIRLAHPPGNYQRATSGERIHEILPRGSTLDLAADQRSNGYEPNASQVMTVSMWRHARHWFTSTGVAPSSAHRATCRTSAFWPSASFSRHACSISPRVSENRGRKERGKLRLSGEFMANSVFHSEDF